MGLPDPPPPAPDAPPPEPPGLTPRELLTLCAAADPGPWFPSQFALSTGADRASLDEPLWELRQSGLIHVADWVKGRGQGFALTGAGRVAQAGPPGADSGDAEPEEETLAEFAARAAGAPRQIVVVPAILALCVAAFVAGAVVAHRHHRPVSNYLSGQDQQTLLELGSVHGVQLLEGQWWRLGAHAFVHVGLAHLVINLVSLGSVGPVVELLWGRRRFAAIYAVSALAGGAAAAAFTPLAVSAGASGAIFGCLTALLAWLWRYRHKMPPGVAGAWLGRVGLVFAVNVGLSLVPGVSWPAHLAGAAVGLGSAVFLDWTRAGETRRRTAAGLAGLAGIVALCAGGLLAATQTSPDWKQLRRDKPTVTEVERALGTGALPTQREQYRKFAGSPYRLSPAQVRQVHQAAVYASASQPGSPARDKVALRVAQLRADLAAPPADAARTPEAWPRYAERAAAVVDLLERCLADDPAPMASDWKQLADAVGELERAGAGVYPPDAKAASGTGRATTAAGR